MIRNVRVILKYNGLLETFQSLYPDMKVDLIVYQLIF